MVPARDYYVVNDVKKVPDLSKREPTLKKNQTMDEGCIRALSRIWHDQYAGIVSIEGVEMNSMWVQKTAELGDRLTAVTALQPKAFVGKLRSHPLCAHVMQVVKQKEIERGMRTFKSVWRRIRGPQFSRRIATLVGPL